MKVYKCYIIAGTLALIFTANMKIASAVAPVPTAPATLTFPSDAEDGKYPRQYHSDSNPNDEATAAWKEHCDGMDTTEINCEPNENGKGGGDNVTVKGGLGSWKMPTPPCTCVKKKDSSQSGDPIL